MYEGTEYDYVFTVELDGQPSLKLPYNVAEDPWMAAHKWLEKHELSPLFLGVLKAARSKVSLTTWVLASLCDYLCVHPLEGTMIRKFHLLSSPFEGN